MYDDMTKTLGAFSVAAILLFYGICKALHAVALYQVR